ncbi:MAG: hypothetical protein R2851_04560 [Caldilineaceae bacterium]
MAELVEDDALQVQFRACRTAGGIKIEFIVDGQVGVEDLTGAFPEPVVCHGAHVARHPGGEDDHVCPIIAGGADGGCPGVAQAERGRRHDRPRVRRRADGAQEIGGAAVAAQLRRVQIDIKVDFSVVVRPMVAVVDIGIRLGHGLRLYPRLRVLPVGGRDDVVGKLRQVRIELGQRAPAVVDGVENRAIGDRKLGATAGRQRVPAVNGLEKEEDLFVWGKGDAATAVHGQVHVGQHAAGDGQRDRVRCITAKGVEWHDDDFGGDEPVVGPMALRGGYLAAEDKRTLLRQLSRIEGWTHTQRVNHGTDGIGRQHAHDDTDEYDLKDANQHGRRENSRLSIHHPLSSCILLLRAVGNIDRFDTDPIIACVSFCYDLVVFEIKLGNACCHLIELPLIIRIHEVTRGTKYLSDFCEKYIKKTA